MIFPGAVSAQPRSRALTPAAMVVRLSWKADDTGNVEGKRWKMGWIHKLAGDKRTNEQRQAVSLNRKALIAMEKGKLDEAELQLEEALRLAPELADVHHNLGAVYLAQKKFSQAQRHIRRAVRLDPEDVESRVALAKVYADMGKAGEAMAAYRDSCARFPEDWRAQLSLGNALLENGRLEDATAHLEKAAALKPQEDMVHLVLAAAYERLGQMDAAIREYEAVRKVSKIAQNRSAAAEKVKALRSTQGGKMAV